MKNKLYIILALFVVYLCTYFFYGKNSLGLQIIEDTSFPKNQNSIQIQLYNLEDYQQHQTSIKSVLEEKGFNKISINYAENFWNKNEFAYWLELQQIAPFATFAYDGIFKKDEISKEYESLYVWCFFKWIRVYKREK